MIAISGGGLRTGSTMMWQVMRDILTNHGNGRATKIGDNISYFAEEWATSEEWYVYKMHGYHEALKPYHDRGKVIVTVRDPRDVIVSLSNYHNRPVDQIIQTDHLMHHNYRQLGKWYRTFGEFVYPFVYENFVGDMEKMVSHVAKIFGIYLFPRDIVEIADRWSLGRNMERAGKHRDHNHYEFLKGNHIHSGAIGQWRTALTEVQVEKIERIYSTYMKEFGYERVT